MFEQRTIEVNNVTCMRGCLIVEVLVIAAILVSYDTLLAIAFPYLERVL